MFDTTRRRMLGTTLLGTGAALSGLGLAARGETLKTKGKVLLQPRPSKGLLEAATFPLIEAIHGRRSRRFAKGAIIPNGPLAFTSRHAPEALHPHEQMLLLATLAGNTGWAELFAHHPNYEAKLPNYTTAAGGRSFPSSAGFNTSEFFYTDDDGVYFLPTRDMQPLSADDGIDLDAWVETHRTRIVKLSDGRLRIPAEAPHMEGHNTWSANVPGSTLVIPVADVAQHTLLLLLYLVQNGTAVYDDVNNRPIPGLEKYMHRLNLEAVWPMQLRRAGGTHRCDGGDGHGVLRGRPYVAGSRPWRLDVHRHQPPQCAGCKWRSERSGAGLPL